MSTIIESPLPARIQLAVEAATTHNQGKAPFAPTPPSTIELAHSHRILDDAASREAYAFLGRLTVEAAVSKIVSILFFKAAANWRDKHDNAENRQLLCSVLSSPSTIHRIMTLIKSYGALFLTANVEDTSTLFFILIGAASTAQYGLRRLQPWLGHYFGHLATGGLKAFDMKYHIYTRRVRCESEQEERDRKKLKTGREIVAAPASVLHNIMNNAGAIHTRVATSKTRTRSKVFGASRNARSMVSTPTNHTTMPPCTPPAKRTASGSHILPICISP